MLAFLTTSTLSRALTHTAIPTLLLPQPEIRSVTLSQSPEAKNQAVVTILGDNMFACTHIRSSELPLSPSGGWFLDHDLSEENVINQQQIKFTRLLRSNIKSAQRPSLSRPLIPAALTGGNFVLTAAFPPHSARPDITQYNKLVRVGTHHPYDTYSLKELLHGALTIALFSSADARTQFQPMLHVLKEVCSQ